MGLISDYFTKTVPANARGLLNEVKRAPQDIRNLFSPEMAATVQQAQANPVDKDKAMGMAMDYLQTTTPTGGLLGMFIGKGAKTFDFLKAKEAEEMLAKGIDPREVWKQTGTMRGLDGMLRQEISDHMSRMSGVDPTDEIIAAYQKGGKEAMMARKAELADYTRPYQRTNTQEIDNVFTHNPLEEAYPDLFHYGKYQYDYKNPVIGEGAYYANKPDAEYATDLIKLSPANEQTARSVMLHELMHPIQKREGFSPGSSIGEFVNGAQINPATGQQTTLDEAYDMYRRSLGEAEARLVQKRMNMTPEERLMSFPYDMLDVPIDQLIVRGLLK